MQENEIRTDMYSEVATEPEINGQNTYGIVSTTAYLLGIAENI